VEEGWFEAVSDGFELHPERAITAARETVDIIEYFMVIPINMG
jgi:hypothetical protein